MSEVQHESMLVLRGVLLHMQLLGEGVVRRFVQDTCQWGPLSLTMAAMLLRNPFLIMRVVAQVRWCGLLPPAVGSHC